MRWLLLPIVAGLACVLWPGSAGSAGPRGSAQASVASEAAGSADAAAQQALADTIDEALRAAWQAENLPVAPPADDALWLRRLSIDLLGTIPDRQEVVRFLSDTGADKRSRKIDEALADVRFAENLSFLWSNLLAASAGKDAERTKPWFRPWLEEAFAQGIPFSTMTREMIAGTGTTARPGSLSFILSYRDAIEVLAGVTARAFLGLQIQCAQCHDHPYDKWKREDFNRFTGFFLDMRADHVVGTVTGTQGGAALFRVIDQSPEWDLKDRLHRVFASARKSADDGSDRDAGMESDAGMQSMSDASTDAPPAMQASMQGAADVSGGNIAALEELLQLCRKAVKSERSLSATEPDPAKLADLMTRLPQSARDLLQKYHDRQELFAKAGFLDGTPFADNDGLSRRAALAEWIVSPKNPWFGQAMANRAWNQLFGKGLIEPVDDLSGSVDRVLPQLLELLGKEFVAHDTDLRFLLGALARTKAYALDNSRTPDKAERAHEERWFAAHGVRPFSAEQMATSLLRATYPDDEQSGRLRSAAAQNQERLRLLDEVAGFFTENSRETFNASIPQALFLMNGGSTDRAKFPKRGPIMAAFVDLTRSGCDRLRELFYAVLSRPPTEAEAEKLLSLVGASARSDVSGFDDLYWALLNSSEFHTNH